MTFEHSSGLSGVYDRTPDKPDWKRVLFREDRVAQAAELMEMQSIIENRGRRVADRVMSDGNRISGAEIIMSGTTATLAAGKIYARGDVRDLPAATLSGLPATGEAIIGVRIVTATITEVDDADMLGLAPGTEAEGEPGAGRQTETAVWGWNGDGQTGDLYQVYLLKDGTPVDQTTPSSLSDVSQAIANYDRDAHGSYVVRGCEVKALGLISGAQNFSVAEGVANINGFKRSRTYALRHVQPEQFDTATVSAEPKTFADSGTGTAVITLNRGPLAAVTQAIVTKEKTATITKGTTGGLDALPDSSVTTIVEVKQGATTYVATTDYTLNADRVDWSPSGAEPASGSSYTVKYRYLAAVTPTATTTDTVTLTGGVTGTAVFLTYTWKMPRTDLLCLDQTGQTVYVKGVSSPANPVAPAQPTSLLALAEVANDWRGTPTITNTEIRSVPFKELWAYLNKVVDALDLIALERLKSDIDNREPVAKKGVFVDPWTDDTYRDAGETQTAAVFDGQMQLPVTPTISAIGPSDPQFLSYTEDVVLRQELATACMLINPYSNFTPLPISLKLNPAADFWTDYQTQWASPVTRTITTTSGSGGTTTTTNVLKTTTASLEYLRQIAVGFTLTGMGAGETLASLTFDGLNVTPAGLVANASGVCTGTFTVPANVPAGTKRVAALGGSGRTAEATFVGQGTVTTTVMRQVTTITRVVSDNSIDPLAQTFTLTESRFICGIDLRVCAVGSAANDILVEIHSVENGFPTEEILAQATVSMTGVSAGQWIAPRFSVPLWLTNDREYAVVVKTNDAGHALSIARLGDFDATAQRYVSAQPYPVGVLLSSSNAKTWTAHQSEDLTFRLVACKFAPVTKTVSLGTLAVSNMSDVLIKAATELATGDAAVIFEVQRAGGDVTRLLPNQPWALTEYVTETITLRAILTGTEKVTPILYPGALFVAGQLMGTGTYITRAFSMGSAIRMSAFVKTKLPSGSALTVDIDAGDDAWTSVAQYASTVIDQGWIEREYRRTPYTATTGRLRLTLTGTPAARPYLSDMRAVSI